MGYASRDILGYNVVESRSGWRVENGTIEVSKRKFYSKSIDMSKVKCFDAKTNRHINVQYFSPVILDLDDQQPKYDTRWEVYDGSGKNKKLVKVNFSYAYIKWWEKQRDRCLNGYTVGGVYITGIHYFYLNFWRIKHKKKGSRPSPPFFLDLDKVFFDDIHRCYQLGKNYLALKRRQIGVSEKVMAVIAYNYTFFPGSESLIIAGESQFADQSFDKLKFGLGELSRFSDSNAGDAFAKRKVIDNQEKIQSGFLYKGTIRGFKSVVYKRIAKNNSQIASGLSVLSTVFFEEAGRFPDLDIVDGMITPIMEEGGVQGEGKIKIYVGTGGEMDKGAALLEQYFYNPDAHNILSFDNEWEDTPDDVRERGVTKCARFFPAWYYFCTDYDGNSYKEIGEILISEKRAGITDPMTLYTEKTQMPLLPSEAFIASGASPFDSVKLSAQKGVLIRHNVSSTYKWGRLDPITDKEGKKVGMQWTTGDPSKFDSGGDLLYPVLLMEFPLKPKGSKNSDPSVVMFSDNQYGSLYFPGTDSYDKGDAPTSDSLGSTSIFMGDVPDGLVSIEGKKYVARLTWRPKERDKFYEMTARMSAFYHGQNLIEWSNIVIFDYYKNNGYEQYLRERPAFAYANLIESTATNRYGVDPSTKPTWERLYAEYISSFSHRMRDLKQVERALAYRKTEGTKRYNCDVSISSMLAYVNYKDSDNQKITAREIAKDVAPHGMMKGFGWQRVNINGKTIIRRA